MPARKTSNSLLATYRAKRDFAKTREPSGTEEVVAGGRTYMIQKHAATRLHYDFRLEMDGVLKSWAVTRGPSLNPADKRLAVQTEDHPVGYATFEGTIPEGEYGGGTVMLWDRGTWEPLGDVEAEMRKGHLRFRLQGERLQGEWHLVRMHGHRKGDGKRENWLLIKADDDIADHKNGDTALTHYTTSVATDRTMEMLAANASAGTEKKKQKKAAPTSERKAAKHPAPRRNAGKEMPPFIQPQLATLVNAPPQSADWIHEIKFDGYRLQARVERGKVTLLTRTAQDWTSKFQPIAQALSKLKTDALIDGEVVAMAEDGTMSFAALQKALKDRKPESLCFFAFDLLHAGGEDLTALPLKERKARLRALIPTKQTRMRYSEDFAQAGKDVLEHACRIDLEGIISKRADAPYRAGRGDDWLKSKCLHEQEFVIGGYTEQPAHPGSLGALLVGYYERGLLIFAGKVGTGFTGEESRALLKAMKKRERKTNPFTTVPTASKRGAHWLEPSLVAQIRFGEWTEAGILRHPAFLALREDKAAEDVTREEAKRLSNAKRTQTEPAKRSAKSKAGFALNGVTLTHPDKLLYPEENITKQQLAEYYDLIAPYMLPHIAGRPISLMRCPDGLRSTKACFFQRHAGEGGPSQLRQVRLRKDEEPFLTLDDASGLTAAVQLGVLELHVWGSTAKASTKPDRVVFDFDPHEEVPFSAVKKAARDMRSMLEKLGLRSFLKTTGGKGLHVVVPIATGPDWDEVRNFSEAMAQLLSDAHPSLYTLNSRKAERVGRIYIDYLRNDDSASAIAPYSTRARAGAPIAWPIDWTELPRLTSSALVTVSNVAAKLKQRKKDPWAEMIGLKQKLPSAGKQ